MRRAAALVAALAAAVAATPAGAATNCRTPLPAVKPILTGQGVLESVIVDQRGRLLYTDTSKNALMVLDRPGAAPRILAGDIASPGGLALDGSDGVLVGRGDGFRDGLVGNLRPASSLLRVDIDTGQAREFASGLQMANGVARGPDGTIYASSDVGIRGIDRISADGMRVETKWAGVVSANGLVAGPRYLYAAQTFVPAAIARVDLVTRKVTTFARPPLLDIAAGLDGMAPTPVGGLVAAANGGGQVWYVSPKGAICVLARGLLLPSAVAYGRGAGAFPAGKLYVVTFSGVVAEVPAGTIRLPAPAAR